MGMRIRIRFRLKKFRISDFGMTPSPARQRAGLVNGFASMHNPCNTQSVMAMIPRALRLPKPPGETFFLWGARQCGKSTLLRQT